jgi:hypothetical protein
MSRSSGGSLPATSHSRADDEPQSVERRLAILAASDPLLKYRDAFDVENLAPLEHVDFRSRPIDPEVVHRLACIMVTEDEIAEVFDVPVDQLKVLFAVQLKNGYAKAKTALRRKQWQVALKGNVSMLIHLGQQHLAQEQRSKVEVSGKVTVEGELDPRQAIFDLITEAAGRLRSLNAGAQVLPMPTLAPGPSDDI